MSALPTLGRSLAVFALPSLAWAADPDDISQCEPIYDAHLGDCSITRVESCLLAGTQVVRYSHFAADVDDDYVEITNDSGDVLLIKYNDTGYLPVSIIDPLSLDDLVSNGVERLEDHAYYSMPVFVDPLAAVTVELVEHHNEYVEIGGISFLTAVSTVSVAFDDIALRMDGEINWFIDLENNVVIEGEARIGMQGTFIEVGGDPIDIIRPNADAIRGGRPESNCGAYSLLTVYPSLRMES